MAYKTKGGVFVKPPAGSYVNLGHHILKSASGLWFFDRGHDYRDLLGKTSVNTVTGVPRPRNRGLYFDGSSQISYNYPSAWNTANQDFTMVASFRYDGTGGMIGGLCTAGWWGPQYLYVNSANNRIQAKVYGYSGQHFEVTTANGSLVKGNDYCVVFSYRNQTIRVFINGQFHGSVGTNGSSMTAGGAIPTYAIGFNESTSNRFTGIMYYHLYYHNRCLSDNEAIILSSDPYCFVDPAVNRRIVEIQATTDVKPDRYDEVTLAESVTVSLPDSLRVNVSDSIGLFELFDVIEDEKMLLYQNNFTGEKLASTQGLVNKASGTFAFTGSSTLEETSPANAHAVLVTAIPKVANLDFKFRQTLSESGSARTFFSPIYRAKTDYTEGYTFIWDGTDIGLYKMSGGSWTLIADTPMTESWTNGDSIFIRVQANSNSHSIKIWKYGEAEPTAWAFTTTDSTYTSANHVGFYHSVQSGLGNDEINEITYVRDLSDSSITVDPTSNLAYFSPYNWRKVGNNRIQSANPGAYFKANFTGTSFKVIVDIGLITTAITNTAHWPTFAYQIDGGTTWTNVQITQSVTTIVSGLSSGPHTIKVVILRDYESYDRWNVPDSAVRILGLNVDANCSITAPTTYSRTMIAYGDSITEGVFVDAWTAFSGNNSTKTWAFYLSDMIKAEVGIIGWSFSGYLHYGNGNVTALTDHWNKYDADTSRLVSSKLYPIPDYVFVEHGTNDGGDNSVIQLNMRNQIASFRGAINSDTKLFIMIPFNQANDANLSQAIIDRAVDNPIEIDLDTAGDDYATGSGFSYDNFHPNATGNLELAKLIYTATGPYIESIPETSDGISVSESVTVTLSTTQINVSDSINILDVPNPSVSGSGVLTIPVSEDITVTENKILLVTSFINKSDAVTITENLSLSGFSRSINVNDNVTVADPIAGRILLITSNINKSDSITVTENNTLSLSNLSINVNDAINLVESNSLLVTLFVNNNDSVSIIDSGSPDIILTRTLYAKSSGGNWSSASTWSDVSSISSDSSGPPSASDIVILDASSGNVTIDSGAVCRSLDCNSYVGTLTHTAAVTLTIGDAIAGTGNRALRFGSGMTYTLGSATTSAIDFVSTSTTQQTITTAGKTVAAFEFNGVGGSWILADSLTMGGATANEVKVTNGSFDTGNQNCTFGVLTSDNANVRSINLGSSTLNLGGASSYSIEITNITNLTWNAGTSTININGGNVAMHPGGLAFHTVNITALTNRFAGSNSVGSTPAYDASQPGILGPTNTFVNFSIVAGDSLLTAFHFASPHTVTGTFTITGFSPSKRIFLWSGGDLNSLGFPALLTVTGATKVFSNVSFMDITFDNGGADLDLSGISGGSGDAGGNSLIGGGTLTFTASETQYWSSNTGNWSDSSKWFKASGGSGGAGRVPLPQDDVVFDASSFSSGSQTVTIDSPNMGRSVDMSAVTNTPTFSVTVLDGPRVYGSLTFASGMTWTQGEYELVFRGRSAYTFTRASRILAGRVSLNAPNGSLTFQDSFSQSGTSTRILVVVAGTLYTNGQSVTTLGLSASTSAPRIRGIYLGSSTVTVTGTGSAWNFTNNSTLTFDAGTSTIVVSNNSSSSKTFGGGGLVYNDVSISSGGSGVVSITGSNTYNNLTINAPKSVRFTAGETHTLNSFTAIGSTGNIITINSSSSGFPATLSKASGLVSSDYLSLKDSVATGGARWYAGGNSTNVSGNSGWFFAVPIDVSDSITSTDYVNVSNSLLSINLSENIAVEDIGNPIISQTGVLTIPVSESIVLTENITASNQNCNANTNDNISVTESKTVYTVYNINRNDNISLTENVIIAPELKISCSDSISLSENVYFGGGINISVYDAVSISESLSFSNNIFLSVTQNVNITENIIASNPLLGSISVFQSVSLSEYSLVDYPGSDRTVSVSDSVAVADIDTVYRELTRAKTFRIQSKVNNIIRLNSKLN